MRLAFIADGRAEHVRRWLPSFARAGDEVLLLSTHPCADDLPEVTLEVLPKLFPAGQAMVKRSTPVVPSRGRGARARQTAPRAQQAAPLPSRSEPRPNGGGAAVLLFRSGLYEAVWSLWHQVGVAEVPLQALVARRLLKAYKPDLTQAIRIQNEGYVAALAATHPWVQLVWGQDFVYFARRYPLHRALTGRTVRVADALIADCRRDIRLAREAGLPEHAPTGYFPGNGGVDLDRYRFGVEARQRDRLVVYPRGIAPYVRLDTLLRSIGLVVRDRRWSDVRFLILVPPAFVSTIREAVAALGLPPANAVVAGFLSQDDLAALLGRAAVVVSPAMSDGTPNSMLEAMACGAFPVMGDVESIREWIADGVNGLLFDPSNPEQLAACLREALDNWALREGAQQVNLALVQERADFSKVLPSVRAFYRELIGIGV